MEFIKFINIIATGLFIGGIYALIGVGMNLIYGVMRVVNITHGEFVMLGAYITYFAWKLLGVNPILTLVISSPLLFFAGWILYRITVNRVVERPMIASLMLTFGLSTILWNTAQALFTTNYRAVPYLTHSITIWKGYNVSANYIVGFILALLLVGGLFSFLKFSRWGKALRATSQNSDVALACGIDTNQVRTTAFGIGAALAGAAGTIIAMAWFIFPQMGFLYLVKAFVITVLGGLGSPIGALGAAFIYGVAENLGTQLLSATAAQAIPFLTLVIVLVIKPTGLFGEAA